MLTSAEAFSLVFPGYPDVVSIEQMCEMLGDISIKTGYALLRENKIKHFKVGRAYRISKLHIFEFLSIIQENRS